MNLYELDNIKKRLENKTFKTVDDTQQAVVNPLLKSLGYDIFDPDNVRTIRCNSVNMIIVNSNILVICIKNIDKLSKDIISKVDKKYFTHDIKIVALTNGDNWWFYINTGVINTVFKYGEVSIKSDTTSKLKSSLIVYEKENLHLIEENKDIAKLKFAKICDRLVNSKDEREVLSILTYGIIDTIQINMDSIENIHEYIDILSDRISIKFKSNELKKYSDDVYKMCKPIPKEELDKNKVNVQINCQVGSSTNEYVFNYKDGKEWVGKKIDYIVLDGEKVEVKSMRDAYRKTIDYLISKDTKNKELLVDKYSIRVKYADEIVPREDYFTTLNKNRDIKVFDNLKPLDLIITLTKMFKILDIPFGTLLVAFKNE